MQAQGLRDVKPTLSQVWKQAKTWFRNMRSKCRCSCVLQFTRHLGVSSVLHRPLSQMIHCIVWYLDFQSVLSECFWTREANKAMAATTHQGEITNSSCRKTTRAAGTDISQHKPANRPTTLLAPTHKLGHKNFPAQGAHKALLH